MPKSPIDFFHQQSLLGYLTWSNKCSTNQTTQQMDLLIPHLKVGIAYIIVWDLTIDAYKCISNISKPSPTATASLGTCSRAGHFCPSILITTQDPHHRTKSWSKNMKKIQHHKSCDLKLGWEHVIRYPREASRNPKKKVRCWMTQEYPRICRPASKIGVQTLQNATWILAINRSVSPIILGNMSNHPQIEDFNWLPGR